MEDRRRSVADVAHTRGVPVGARRGVVSLGLLALLGATTLLLPHASAAPAAANDDAERAARERAARDARLEGADERVIQLLEAATDRSDLESALLGEAQWRLGRMGDARKTWSGCVTSVACALAQGQRELRAGDRTIALKVLTKAMARHKDDVQLRGALGEALYRVGQDVAARRLLDPLADLYQDGKIHETAERVAVARSLAANGYFKDANDVLADTAEGASDRAERKLVEGAWGELFLTKYNFRDADVAFRRVLAIDPNDEDALLGMARIDLDSDHDIAKARGRADAMLKRNPSSVPALALRAEVAMHDEDLETAQALVQKAAQIVPNHGAVLALRFTLATLANDTKAASAALAAAHKVDPGDAEPLLIAARALEMGHRYREVVAALQAAITRDPDNWAAHAALGLGLSRMADDKGALEHLELAYRNDPFNVRTANVLNVLYDGVLKHMVLLRGAKIDLRVHKRDRQAFERTLLPFLQQSHDELSERYAMTPERPMQVEVFPTTEQFSVRTIGLPRLGAHAVCFGHLITSRSPSEEPFNWKLVLYHELAHVFHIQATGGRVPRWLTEGLAMRESERLDPRFHMIMERQLYDRWVEGGLTPIATFNLAFSQARTGQDIMMAYYQSFWLVKYLEQAHGFDKLRRLVAGHANGKATTALIQQIYGQTAQALDAAFASWLGAQLRRFDADYRPSLAALQRAVEVGWAKDKPSEPLLALRAWAEAMRRNDPASAFKFVTGPAKSLVSNGTGAAQAAAAPPSAAATPAPAPDETGGAKAGAGDAKAAPAATAGGLDAIVAAGPTCALMALGLREAMARNAVGEAELLAAELVRVPAGRCDGVQQRVVLAQASARSPGGREQARRHLEAAAIIDPRDPAILRGLLQLGKDSLSPADKRALLRRAMELDANDATMPLQLAQLTWRELAPLLGLPLPATKAAPAGAPAAAPTTPASPAPAAATAAPSGTKAALVDDLRLAARGLEETTPTSRDAVLVEARLAMAQDRPKVALPAYQLALDRSDRPAQRRIIWCELEVAAERAQVKVLHDEAKQRCAEASSPR